MIQIDTDYDIAEIIEAIDVVTGVVIDKISERNQFAESMIHVDPDAAQNDLDINYEDIRAVGTLLDFASHMIAEETTI